MKTKVQTQERKSNASTTSTCSTPGEGRLAKESGVLVLDLPLPDINGLYYLGKVIQHSPIFYKIKICTLFFKALLVLNLFAAMSVSSIISKYILIHIAKKLLVERQQNVKIWAVLGRLS